MGRIDSTQIHNTNPNHRDFQATSRIIDSGMFLPSGYHTPLRYVVHPPGQENIQLEIITQPRPMKAHRAMQLSKFIHFERDYSKLVLFILLHVRRTGLYSYRYLARGPLFNSLRLVYPSQPSLNLFLITKVLIMWWWQRRHANAHTNTNSRKTSSHYTNNHISIRTSSISRSLATSVIRDNIPFDI